MSITQNSRIQHRRGLSTDLPTLETSELGHVIDERRLFIGNGTLVEGAPVVGNTELITEYTLLSNPDAQKYTYQSNTPTTADTGVTPSSPTVRSIVEALDDLVSVKAYGALGDGSTDDSDAINRCMADIYGPAPSDAVYRRRVYFPAGTYVLDSNIMIIPPYTELLGDGPDKTIIKMVNLSQNMVARTADSNMNTDLQIGDGGAITPRAIRISQMSFEHDGNQDVIHLDRVIDVVFDRCGFKLPGTVGEHIKLDSLGGVFNPQNISIANCRFDGGAMVSDINSDAPGARDISFNGCKISNVTDGIHVTHNGDNIHIINCFFDNITQTAVRAGSISTNVNSSNNVFINSGSVGFHVIEIEAGAQNARSVNDSFASIIGAPIRDLGVNSFITGPMVDKRHQDMTQTGVRPTINLAPGSVLLQTGIEFDTTRDSAIFIDYTLKRDVGGSIFTRVGRLHIATDGVSGGTGTVIGDFFTESGPTGITFDYDFPIGNTLYVVFNSTAGNAAEMKYQIKSWDMN